LQVLPRGELKSPSCSSIKLL